MRNFKKVLICTATALAFTIPNICAYAVNNNVTQMQNFELNQSNNGGSINLQKQDNNKYILDIDTKELEEGYYTTYLYNKNNVNSDWAQYAGICFYIKNESESDANINVNIKTKDNKVLTVKDEDSIFIKKNGTSYFERIHPLHGTAKIEKGVEGTVYIPFNILKDNENNYGSDTILNVESWGIVATSKENEKKKIIFGNFNFINLNNDYQKDFDAHYSVKGDTEVQIPTAGESVSDYKLVDNHTNENILNSGAKVEYFIDGEEEGISINNDGRLTVTKDAVDKKIKAYALINDEVREEFEVQLLKSWTLSAKEVDGTSKSIPSEDEIINSSISKTHLFSSNKFIMIFRICSILIPAGMFLLYCTWKKQRKEKLK